MFFLFSVLSRRWGTFVTLLILGGATLLVWVVARPGPGDEEKRAIGETVAEKVAAKDHERQLAELRLKLGALEAQSRDDEERRRELELQRSSILASIAEIDRQVESLRSKQDRARARIRLLEADEHRLREGVPTGNEQDRLESPTLEKLRAEMNRIRGEIALGGLERTPSSPEYGNRTRRLAELEISMRSELYKARVETILALKESILAMDADLRALDERRLKRTLDAKEVSRKMVDIASSRDEIAALRKKIEEGESQRRTAASPAPMSAPLERPALSSARSIAWGAAAILALAVLGAFWRDWADPRVRTDADVKRRLNLPVVAMVEDAQGDPLTLRRPPGDPLCENMSTAATVLRSYMAGREFRTLAVLSAREGEGKTTTALNLACAFARKGLNVLLVDADLRRPRIHEIYRLDNSVGLTTILLGPEPAEPERDPGEIIVQTEMSTLRLLGSGPTNEIVADLHDSPRMLDFLRGQRERFDIIVLDAAPLLGIGDTVALARIVDTCVWVVRSGASDRKTLGWAKHLLKTVHADVAGVVLNFAPSSQGEKFYTYAESPAKA